MKRNLNSLLLWGIFIIFGISITTMAIEIKAVADTYERAQNLEAVVEVNELNHEEESTYIASTAGCYNMNVATAKPCNDVEGNEGFKYVTLEESRQQSEELNNEQVDILAKKVFQNEETVKVISEEQAETQPEEALKEEVSDEDNIIYDENGVAYKIVETMEFTATAYCHCEKCCDKAPEHPQYGVTASGMDLLVMLEQGIIPRVIAADKNVFPFGTKVYIEVPESEWDMYISSDYGFATVEDRGGAIKNRKIDVYYPTEQEALEWGRRNVLVHILELVC